MSNHLKEKNDGAVALVIALVTNKVFLVVAGACLALGFAYAKGIEQTETKFVTNPYYRQEMLDKVNVVAATQNGSAVTAAPKAPQPHQ